MPRPTPRHNKPLADLLRVKLPPKMVGCEIGVYDGQLSKHLLTEFPELTLFMVDPWEGFTIGGKEVTSATMQKAKRIAENSVAFARDRCAILPMPSMNAATLITASLDFVFIDGDHSYEAVTQDIENWYPLVRSGGLVIGHDYLKSSKDSVNKAVNEFVNENNYMLHRIRSCRVWWIQKR